MPRPRLILPQADAACGKVFFADRRTADGHRIGLEVWNRATGRVREGYRLAVYRCKRCGGFHIGYRPAVPIPQPSPSTSEVGDGADHHLQGTLDNWGCEPPHAEISAHTLSSWSS